VRISETTIITYFGYLLLASLVLGPSPKARRAVAIASAMLAVSAALLSRLPSSPPGLALRDWAPLVYLLSGYWLPVLLLGPADVRLERRLLALDRRLFAAAGLERLADRGPRAALEYLELAYLFCYPLVPLAFGILYFGGAAAAADRFWTAVLFAVYPCYGLLPWLPMRPPRAVLEDPLASSRALALRPVNLRVLDAFSVQANTFPSGHAAGSLAAALVVFAYLPVAGSGLILIALSIAVASVVGRYHYAADAILGIGLAGVACGVSAITASG
jgi:hypothetical protein